MQAVKRPWDEEPTAMTEEMMKTISLEVVREKMLNYIHQVSLKCIVKIALQVFLLVSS